MPDVFVGIDTTSLTKYYLNLVRGGVLNRFILSYIDRNREQLILNYPDFESYRNDFVVDDSLIDLFVKYGESEGVELNEKELNISLGMIANQIKALIAKDLWSMNEYFELINISDNTFLKAFEIISDRRIYQSLIRHN